MRYYQAYFRTERGGVGLPYSTSRHEFLAALGPRCSLRREWPGRFRVAFDWDGPEDELARLVPRLGYTQAVLSVDPTPASGRDPDFRMGSRWPVGRLRERGFDLDLREFWVSDEGLRLDASPHRDAFEFDLDAGATTGGPRRGRRLSPLDARMIVNVSGLPDGARVLAPFAGLGGVARAAAERGLLVVGSDWDTVLLPGLRQRLPGGVLLADARSLPFADGEFDGLLTEPPYHRADRDALADAVPELARVVRSGGVLVLLVADFLRRVVAPPACGEEEHALWVPRHGIRCLALVWRRR